MASTSQSNEFVLNNFSNILPPISSIDSKEENTVEFKIPKIAQCSKSQLPSKISLQSEKDSPVEELLGSVTTFNNVLGGSEQALRTSARVIKKLKQDSLVNTEKDKKELRIDDKTEIKPKVKTPKAPWSVTEKNLFFEALNEFGKDFESITQYISSKMKRRGVCDNLLKTKDQVRHFYYRTWNKISKFITFNSSLKKVAQELYVLINYGEMRKKIFLINDKTALKLSELIYRGSVPLRMKGKTFRIKTPMCKALRKLNQMEEWQEELKLPTRVLVVLQPSNLEAWHRVQSVAHNPRVTAMMPIQRRLSNLLSILNDRWKTYDTKLLQKLTEEDKKIVITTNNTSTQGILHFGPRVGVHVNKPIINLSEYMTCNRICLNSYEDRLGIAEKSETIFASTIQNFKGGGSKKGAKRQRSDSGGDKKSNDTTLVENDNKKIKIENEMLIGKKDNVESIQKSELSDTILVDDTKKNVSTLQVDTENKLVQETKVEISLPVQTQKAEVKSKTKEKVKVIRKKPQTETKTLDKETENKIEERFKYGWTLEDATDVTFGDLYLMFGADSKIQMEYWWDDIQKPDISTEDSKSDNKILKDDAPSKKLSRISKEIIPKDGGKTAKDQNENISKRNIEGNVETHLLLPCKAEIAIKVPDNQSDKILQTTQLTHRLKQLLFCLKATDKLSKNSCSCGHICNDKSANSSKNSFKRSHASMINSDMSNDQSVQSYISQKSMNLAMRDSSVFRPPLPVTTKAIDNFENQINSLLKIKPRWNNRRGRTKQVVQRMLPLLPNASTSAFMNANYSTLDLTSKVHGQQRTVTPRQLNFGPDAPHNANRQPDLIIQKIDAAAEQNPTTSTNETKIPVSKLHHHPKQIKQVTCTIVSTDIKSIDKSKETKVEMDNKKQECDIDEIPGVNIMDDISIGSSTIAEAQAAIIRSEQFDLLEHNQSPCSSSSPLLNTPENMWYNSDLHDFSLSSFLGHLESPVKPPTTPVIDEVKISQDVDSNMQSLINESSIDYMAKFAALAAQISNESSNK